MKWVAISGSGRGITDQIEKDVRDTVHKIISSGDGIVTGGVLGVDYISTDEVLALKAVEQIKVCLPSTREIYLKHFKERKDVSEDESKLLENQLHNLYTLNPNAIIELQNISEVTKDAYEKRNDLVLSHADKLIAFQVNNSKGTQYTIEKARDLGIETEIHSYTVES